MTGFHVLLSSLFIAFARSGAVTITPKEHPLEIPEGGYLQLVCTGSPDSDLSWHRVHGYWSPSFGPSLESNGSVDITRTVADNGSNVITLTDTNVARAGFFSRWYTYVCKDQAQANEVDAVEVVVRDPVTIMPNHFEYDSMTVPVGASFQLYCMAGPNSALAWFKFGRRLESSGHLTVTRRMKNGNILLVLHETNVEEGNAGWYRCVDEAGQKEAHFFIRVQGVEPPVCRIGKTQPCSRQTSLLAQADTAGDLTSVCSSLLEVLRCNALENPGCFYYALLSGRQYFRPPYNCAISQQQALALQSLIE